MQILRLDRSSGPAGLGRPVATIGNFDGLHLGHQRMIEATRARARVASAPAVVITFEPHPVRVLYPEASFRTLRTIEQRTADLALTGIDALVVIRFDAALVQTSAEDFVAHFLVGCLAVSTVLVGHDFRFGHARRGGLDLLRTLGCEHGFAAVTIPALKRAGAPVSSTRIRQALAAGDVALARRLLGRGYRVEGRVERGAGRGRALLVPTANLQLTDAYLPAPGVYVTRATLHDTEHRAATFIGAPATFGESRAVCETHLLDWRGGDLYGAGLTIEFLSRLRGPVAFASLDLLRAQIESDLRAARRRLRR